MDKIKFIFCIIASVAIMDIGISGCKGTGSSFDDDGIVHGVRYGNPGKEMGKPANMVHIPTGSFMLGTDAENPLVGGTSVTVNGFWMDKYEVTNSQYHEFVNWVRDSIAALELGYVHVSPDGDTTIDWTKASKINYRDSAITGRLTGLMLPPEDLINNKPELDTKKLIYKATGYDYEAAARHPDQPRKNFIYTYSVAVYPDTLAWIKDFDYSYNVPMARDYFSNPVYQDYPVVGVSWRQAMAFAHWRTMYMNQYLAKKKLLAGGEYRLPTEAEWEYAARGGHKDFIYPWGNYVKNSKGCIMANFKDGKGNYTDDGALYPVRVDSYFPNDYGLYNMAGNVAEWTESNYVNGYQAFDNDFNPNIDINTTDDDPIDMKRKVVRGGSWKDPAVDVRVNSRSYEYLDSSRSYIGFRCVIDVPPASRK